MTQTPDSEIIEDLEAGYNVSLSPKKAKEISMKLKRQKPKKNLKRLQNYRDTYSLED